MTCAHPTPGAGIYDSGAGFIDSGAGADPEPPRADPGLHSLPVPPELSLDVFLTFSYPSHLKHLLLRAFLEGILQKSSQK